jgi:drug/metabolite transporter (DMT)-like permease
MDRGLLPGLGAVLLWSTVATAFKLSLRYVSELQLLAGSSAVSFAALLSIAIIQGKARQLWPDRPQLLRAAGLGLLNPFLYYVVLFRAYALLPAQEAQVLNYTWAITLSVLSVPMLGHRLGRRDLLAILISYGGVATIATRGELLALRFHDAVGVGLALGSTVIWALYWLLNARDDRDPVVGLAQNFAFGLVYSLAAVVLLSPSPIAVGGMYGLAGCVYVGLFEMGLTFVLWLHALRRTAQASRISTLIFLSPPLSLLFIRSVVGEPILPSTIVGLVFVLAGVLLSLKGSREDAGNRARDTRVEHEYEHGHE